VTVTTEVAGIVNDARAVSAGTVPTSLPETWTVYVADWSDGTVNVQEKVPLDDAAVAVHD